MEKTRKPVPWFSGILATLIATFITLAVLPNTDRPRMDNSISPTRFYIEPQPLAAFFVLALAFSPVVCIFFLSRRWKYFEYLAWAVLIFLAASLVF
jgi:formate hydrogenlyase subunit 3/multisubunit Na+/H+ antiporter MnhD subunit